MAIPYIWRCSACDASNPAGSDKCAACGINAITTGREIRLRAKVPQGPTVVSEEPAEIETSPPSAPLPEPKKTIAMVCGGIALAGLILERFTFPTMAAWYIAIGMIAVGGISVWVIVAAHKGAQKHDT